MGLFKKQNYGRVKNILEMKRWSSWGRSLLEAK